jgi:hypothetical protein
MSLPTIPAPAADISNSDLTVAAQEALASLATDVTNLQVTLTALVAWSKASAYAASTVPAPAAVQTTASGALAYTGPTDNVGGVIIPNQA